MRFAGIDSCGTDAVRMQLNRMQLNRMKLNRMHLSLPYSDSASLSDLSSKSAKVHAGIFGRITR